MIEAQGPDGQRLQFPDGTSRETMRAAMAKRYPPPAGGPKSFDAAGARAAGYSDAEISAHLGQGKAKPAPKAPSGFGLAAAQRLIDLAAKSQGKAESDATKRFAGRDMSRVASAQGLFFNGADEIEGAGAYLETAAKNGVRRLMGDDAPYSAKQAFDTVRQRYDDIGKADAARRPVGAAVEGMGAGIIPAVAAAVMTGGGAAIPALTRVAPAISKVPAIMRLMAASGALGTAGGAVSGGLGAQPGERAEGAKSGAAVGGIAGLAVPVALNVAGRALAPLADPAIAGARAFIASAKGDKAGAARAAAERLSKPEQRVALALERARARDAAGGHVETPDMAPYQGGGENVAGLAELVAQSPGPGRQVVRHAIQENQAATQNAIKGDIGESLGGRGDYFEHIDSQQGARKAAVKPLFDEAFGSPLEAEAFNAEFGALMGRLPKGALDEAFDIARKEGRDPVDLGFEVSPASGDIPSMVGVKTPTVETLHYVKKGIDQTLEKYRNDVTGRLDLSGSPGARADAGVRSDLAAGLRRVSEPYDQAMTRWGDDSDHIEAFKLGGNVLSETFDMQSEQVRRVVTDMSEEARAEYTKGVGEAILRKVRGQGGGIGAMRKLLKNEDVAEKVQLAFPTAEAFEDFMERAGVRVGQEARNQQLWGNSRTFGRQAAADDLELNDDALNAAIDVATLNLHGLAKGGIMNMFGKKGRSVLDDDKANLALAKAVTDPAARDNLLRLLALQRAQSINSGVPKASGYLAAPAGAEAARGR